MITSEKLDETCMLCDDKAEYTLDSSESVFSFCDKCRKKVNTLVKKDILAIKRKLEPIFIQQFLHIYRIPTPKEMVEYLDKHIVGQEKAKKIVSIAIYNHFKAFAINAFKTSALAENNHLASWVFDQESEIRMGNVLLIGPPGSGKTLILDHLAKHYNLPIVIVDANTFSEAGTSGKDATSIGDLLVHKAEEIIGLCHITPITSIRDFAQMGIVYIDEVDKIISSNQGYETNGIQESFLTLLEGSELPITSKAVRKPFQKGSVLLDTSNILFIAGGAFIDLKEYLLKKRKTSIGFTAKVISIDRHRELIQKDIQHEDLISFGFLPEFIARFQTIGILNELTHTELKEILTQTKYSLQDEYEKLFEIDNCKITFTDGAIDEIVKQAMLKKCGARSLRSVLEELLLNDMYIVADENVTEIHINRLRVQRVFTPHKLYAVA